MQRAGGRFGSLLDLRLGCFGTPLSLGTQPRLFFGTACFSRRTHGRFAVLFCLQVRSLARTQLFMPSRFTFA